MIRCHLNDYLLIHIILSEITLEPMYTTVLTACLVPRFLDSNIKCPKRLLEVR